MKGLLMGISAIIGIVLASVALVVLTAVGVTIYNVFYTTDIPGGTEGSFDRLVDASRELDDGEFRIIPFSLDGDNDNFYAIICTDEREEVEECPNCLCIYEYKDEKFKPLKCERFSGTHFSLIESNILKKPKEISEGKSFFAITYDSLKYDKDWPINLHVQKINNEILVTPT